jgi:uncharacterized protein
MRCTMLVACLLALPAVAFAQEKRDPDGSDAVLKDLAKAFKDDRTLEQIKKDNALIRAATAGDADGIRKALNAGALINSRYLDGEAFLDEGDSGYTALMAAVVNKRTDTVKLLIENKADLEVKNHKGWTAIYLAVVYDQSEAVDLLVKAGAKQDPTKIRLSRDLINAACKGFALRPNEPYPPYPGAPRGGTSNYPDIIDVLNKGADVNMANPRGYTALMYAANLGLVENVKLLLAKGADAKLEPTDGATALSLAARDNSSFRPEQRREIAKMLNEHLAKQK